MAIPKNVPGPGDAQRRPQGIPQSPPQGLPRMQRPPGNPAPNPNERSRPVEQPRPQTESNRPDFGLPPIDTSNNASHTSEYGFGGSTSRTSRISEERGGGRVVNPYDEEDAFTSLSVDEVLDFDENDDIADREARERERERADRMRREADNREAEAQRQRQEAARRNAEAEQKAAYEDSLASDEDEDVPSGRKSKKDKGSKGSKGTKDKKGQDVFVDEETKQLLPFGGKRKLKVNEFDGRKNLRQRAKIVQIIVIAILLVMAIFAGKNALFPQKPLEAPEIQGIIAETVGITNFPLENGKGFAKDFMQAYLTVNGSAESKSVLGYFYNGVLGAADSPNRSTSQGFKQNILFGPTVYEAVALTDYSARYTIGALVQASPVDGAPPADGSSAKWEYFNVNVFYDEATASFSITKDSPTVIPAVEVGDPANVPNAAPLGVAKADQEVADKIQSVVHGFIKGYAVSSPSDHSTIDQYIISDADESLLRGLNNTYVLAGSEADAIQYQAFTSANAGELKIAVVVNWRDQLGASDPNTKLEYKSNYVMTLQEQSNGKYLVSKFAPQYYVMDEE